MTGQLNQAARRILRSESEDDWAAAVLDAAELFAARVVLLKVNGRSLKIALARGLETGETPPQDEVPLDSAPALASAVDSRDTVVALRTPKEISETVARLFDPTPAQRCYLFAITARDRVAALLYAEDDDLDPSILEALASVAGSGPALYPDRARSAGLITLSGAGPRPEVETHLQWAQLPREEQARHLRAQRFARVRVAQMLLHKTAAVRAGRADHRLYAELREDIDPAREAFRDFFQGSPAMVDYLHLELVRTLAKDDASLLGDDYPGPLA
jgi:hypothetical protein